MFIDCEDNILSYNPSIRHQGSQDKDKLDNRSLFKVNSAAKAPSKY